MTDVATTPVDTVVNDTPEGRRLRYLMTVAGKAGVNAALTSAPDALKAFEVAMEAKRGTEALLRRASEEVTTWRAAVEWELKGRFVSEGNKTYLVDGDEKTQVTADEKKAWIAREAEKDFQLVQLLAYEAECNERVIAARDDLVLADKRLSMVKYELQATTQILATLSSAF